VPPYCGPALRRFRGTSADERRRRTYGIAWTSDIEIADNFAQERRSWPEGGVLLETIVRSSAISARAVGTFIRKKNTPSVAGICGASKSCDATHAM